MQYEGVNVTGRVDQDGDTYVEAYRNKGEPAPFDHDVATPTRGGRVRYIVWLLPVLVVVGCLVAYVV